MPSTSKKVAYNKKYRQLNPDRVKRWRHGQYIRDKEIEKERARRQYIDIRTNHWPDFLNKRKAWWREYYPKNKQKVLAMRKRNRGVVRNKALIIVGRGKIECVRCKCSDVRIIEINHINGKGSQEKKSIYRTNQQRFIYDIINGVRGISDLELLCKVCNTLHYLELRFGIRGKVTWEEAN